ncbi:hypothetical protein [Pseudomonas sp. ZB1P45]|uniref:hypothetical protein n=1 Tax=Pseudomonas frigoris TaxID=3398356 RepID=UPI0039EDEDAD
MTDNICYTTRELVHARLRLAQALLEESDRLEGFEGYAMDTAKYWLHARHEREALVTYLLLTCFDILGRKEKHLTFADWVNSKKDIHIAQKQIAVDMERDGNGDDPLGLTKLLLAKHSEIFGVKNSFYSGMDTLTDNGKQKLFCSIHLGYLPGHCNEPNVSYPLEPIDDPAKDLSLKKAYIFKKRNNFTHNLEQFQMASMPMHTMGVDYPAGSWMAKLEDGKITYWGVHSDRVPYESGHYHFSLSQWPFVLFEVLYEAINIPFDITNIDLKFYLWVISTKNKKAMRLPYVPHSIFKCASENWAFVESLDDEWPNSAAPD